MSGFKPFIIGLICFALFTIALLGYAINEATDNGSAISLGSDSQISALYSGTQQNLSEFYSGSGNTTASIINSSISSGSQTTSSAGQFAITPASAIGVSKNIAQVGYVKIFGNNSNFGIFFWTFIGILGFTVGMFIWKAWIGRQID